MKNITTNAAREILASDLSDEQVARAIESAANDAAHWTQEAASGTLPDVGEMHLDWEIHDDLVDAGVDARTMQRLSFAIAQS